MPLIKYYKNSVNANKYEQNKCDSTDPTKITKKK